ncbi:TPA: Gfo/Idh/MocA family oxidoreductase, partial [Enterococcus faecium]|nr:Gfo/Idh/MocA family oxidoreductase [Enterococcus faecium]MDV4928902.1 Gfo/Idh/MocA family oxidoreductase [Enterococcus faecium]HAQ0789074.1 Gfo/Idh/MocA family oxidoreductase [Enterococcus faecium]HAQ4252422.1 Gfo/Idh/MocA family oxidoreductase [Enterococcus faecium]HAR1499999.1 Gfo/Idh/MocA family oxidoreductase [Enterococcus faecium]
MEVIIMNVGFIGAGKVGCSFGKYFQEHKIQVTGFYSKSEDSSLAASNFTSSKQYLNLRELVDENDTIFITTPDGQIQEVWQEIKNYQIKNKLICHCSGAISSDIFSNI